MKTQQYNGSVPEWLMGADCKSAGYTYVGSNPTRPKNEKIYNSSAQKKYYNASIRFHLKAPIKHPRGVLPLFKVSKP